MQFQRKLDSPLPRAKTTMRFQRKLGPWLGGVSAFQLTLGSSSPNAIPNLTLMRIASRGVMPLLPYPLAVRQERKLCPPHQDWAVIGKINPRPTHLSPKGIHEISIISWTSRWLRRQGRP